MGSPHTYCSFPLAWGTNPDGHIMRPRYDNEILTRYNSDLLSPERWSWLSGYTLVFSEWLSTVTRWVTGLDLYYTYMCIDHLFAHNILWFCKCIANLFIFFHEERGSTQNNSQRDVIAPKLAQKKEEDKS